MAIDRKEPDEGFIGRWSRLKTEAREAPPVAPEPPQHIAESQEAPPELPPLEKLTFDSEFKGFFHPKVDEDVRRAALRKLFSDPHFNVMDGLDVYIDDYSKSDPIPAAMLASLKQAQRIIEWANEKDAGQEASKQTEAPADTDPVPASAATPAIENGGPPPIEPAPERVRVDKPEAGA
jgi:hypothetical protein